MNTKEKIGVVVTIMFATMLFASLFALSYIVSDWLVLTAGIGLFGTVFSLVVFFLGGKQ